MPTPTFETFTGGNGRQAGAEPFVTLMRRGNLGLNQAAYEAMGKPAAVVLLWDRNARIIGLKPADTSTPHARRLLRPNQAQYYTAAAQAFFRWAEISDADMGRYPVSILQGRILAVDLNEGKTVTQRRAAVDAQPSAGA